MNDKDYYKEELKYMRKLGREFSETYPNLAPFLGNEGTDPDVERLLQGFAFLTAKLQKRIDNAIPEITHSFLSTWWKHFGKCIPSMTIVQFKLLPAVDRKKTIKKNAELASRKIENHSCRYRTCRGITLYPLEVRKVESIDSNSRTTINIRIASHNNAAISELGVDSLEFYIDADSQITLGLLELFNNHIQSVKVRARNEGGRFGEAYANLECNNFGTDYYVLDEDKFSRDIYQDILEYSAFSQKFSFFRISNLGLPLAACDAQDFEISIELDVKLEYSASFLENNIKLGCVPAVNIYKSTTTPVNKKKDTREIRLLPEATKKESHIYEITRVIGLVKGSNKKIVYRNQISGFKTYPIDMEDGSYAEIKKCKMSVRHHDTYLQLMTREHREEVITADILASDGYLTDSVAIGDVILATESVPEYVTFVNVTKPTRFIPEIKTKEIYRELLAVLATSTYSLANVDNMRTLISAFSLATYDNKVAKSVCEKRIASIKDIREERGLHIEDGLILSKRVVIVALDTSNFSASGELLLFEGLLEKILTGSSAINEVTEVRFVEVHQY